MPMLRSSRARLSLPPSPGRAHFFLTVVTANFCARLSTLGLGIWRPRVMEYDNIVLVSDFNLVRIYDGQKIHPVLLRGVQRLIPRMASKNSLSQNKANLVFHLRPLSQRQVYSDSGHQPIRPKEFDKGRPRHGPQMTQESNFRFRAGIPENPKRRPATLPANPWAILKVERVQEPALNGHCAL